MRTHFQNQEVCELRNGDARVLVAPDFGARLLTWEINDAPIIFWPQNADWSSASTIAHTRGGNPILFPFIARHYANGVLGQWQDASGTIRELPMHGFAREMAFELVEESDRVLRIRIESNATTRAMYPFDFVFDVVYALNGSTLETTFETTNTGKNALPYYAGHHWYFAIPHEQRASWQIDLPCRTWGRQNPGGDVTFEPTQNTSTTLDDATLIDRFHLDFTQPRVLLTNHETQQKIAVEWDAEYSDLWRYVTTWTQAPDSDFFCVEPWLGLPNAIHHGHGLRWIEPGQKEVAVCRIVVS